MGLEIITIAFFSILTICAYFICKNLDNELQWFKIEGKNVENQINKLHSELIEIQNLREDKQ